ncbi:L-lactate permease [Pseudaquabacterium terrae]|uniref:L-lactate permease n=1 Tax=Pseudaquabacterium terrae TaxID=2732868 RepID=UPI001FE93340|nr:L-lactate permease [Aquabacterium terrae]
MTWQQIYDPFGSMLISTTLAAVPVVVMLVGLGFLHLKAHIAAAAGLVAALAIAIFAYGMPAEMAGKAAMLGGFTGLLPIGWIVLNIIFLHRLADDSGMCKIQEDSIANITNDRRLQLLLIAFSYGAFFEGAAGFGTPVAVTAAILIGLGFSPLAASGLSLIANTAPVAYGALGTPIITLAKVHGYDVMEISAMVGRQLPFFSVLVPFWLIWAFAGRKAMWEIWPAILVSGVSFAIPQFLVSNYIGPELVDVIAAISSMVCLVAFLRVWKPKTVWTSTSLKQHRAQEAAAEQAQRATGGSGAPGLALAGAGGPAFAMQQTTGAAAQPAPGPAPLGVKQFTKHPRAAVLRAWLPWLVLTVFVFIWGLPPVKNALNGLFAPAFPIDGLHKLIEKVPPVVPKATAESAVYTFNLLSATGTGILLAALIGGFLMKYQPLQILKTYGATLWRVRYSLLTIVLMLGLGTLTRYSGLDTTLGLAFAGTGALYPFFGTLMGWLGVALTGSDTASNVLFGGMQKVAAEQLGLSPNLMGAANSSGGVMGKMIDAQSIVVASTATGWFNHEGDILRYVFMHSLALACLVGILVTLQAYVYPFTLLVIH